MKFNTQKKLRNEIIKQYDKHPEYIDVTNWDVSNVKTMKEMFYGCYSLKQIKGIENWDVSNVKDMHGMFYHCENLDQLDLTNWDVSNVEYMYNMFYECPLEEQYGKDGVKLVEQQIEKKQNKTMKM